MSITNEEDLHKYHEKLRFFIEDWRYYWRWTSQRSRFVDYVVHEYNTQGAHSRAFVYNLYLNNTSLQQIRMETCSSIKEIKNFIAFLKEDLKNLIIKYVILRNTPQKTIPYFNVIVNCDENRHEYPINLKKFVENLRKKYHKHIESCYLFYYDINFDRTKIYPFKIFPKSMKNELIITNDLLKSKSIEIDVVSEHPFLRYNS